MIALVICLAAAVVVLSGLVKLNDFPRHGHHLCKLGMGLHCASAVLFALLTITDKPAPAWLFVGFLAGTALEWLGAAPYNWVRWVRHGERRRTGNPGRAMFGRRKTDHA